MRRNDDIGRRTALAAVTVLLLLMGAVVSGCVFGDKTNSNKTPVDSVEGLLQLRSERSTDTAAYMRHLESTNVAAALVTDAAARAETDTPLPQWAAPELTKEASGTAEVTVKWKADDRFEGWPKSTIFVLKKVGGAWLVTDARDQAASKETTRAP